MVAAPLGVTLLLASLAVPRRARGLYDAEHRIESARLYGNIDVYSYYFVDVTVGTPPQRVSVILDTGSGILAFPCAGCNHCGKHVDPLFDVSRSSSARWVGCGKSCHGKTGSRGTCRNDHCTYSQSYLEGSSLSGYWFEDYVHLGDSIQHNPPVYARTGMGCHQNENNLFYTQKANGIFGILGAHTLLRTTLFADKEHVNSDVGFSICLSTEGGRLTVGGHNQTNLRGPVQYVHQVGSGYEVKMTSIVVQGRPGWEARSIEHFHDTVIDSGGHHLHVFQPRSLSAVAAGYRGF
ncbi:unnamed protein product [Prorocentrum cordatum]|uniref:Peptidase A1 domain-containing protein n=1 Tax=Prorocentrum cordatum TaxID=2364126 RepID=A0ABN9TYP7_9DINO|nr:unnamed protein product [Polarella glacialis]